MCVHRQPDRWSLLRLAEAYTSRTMSTVHVSGVPLAHARSCSVWDGSRGQVDSGPTPVGGRSAVSGAIIGKHINTREPGFVFQSSWRTHAHKITAVLIWRNTRVSTTVARSGRGRWSGGDCLRVVPAERRPLGACDQQVTTATGSSMGTVVSTDARGA